MKVMRIVSSFLDFMINSPYRTIDARMGDDPSSSRADREHDFVVTPAFHLLP
jgi:hypothetical protein